MSVTLADSSPRPPSPNPSDDRWIALVVAIDLAAITGFLTNWEIAATVLIGVLTFFAGYRDTQR